MNVQLETAQGDTLQVEVSMRFDELTLDQSLAVAAVLGEADYQTLISEAGTVTSEAARALVWAELCGMGYQIPWEAMEGVDIDG